MPECDKPCYCHYTYIAECCEICQPPKMAEPTSPLDAIAEAPQYKETGVGAEKMNAKCQRCFHPARSHTSGSV